VPRSVTPEPNPDSWAIPIEARRRRACLMLVAEGARWPTAPILILTVLRPGAEMVLTSEARRAGDAVAGEAFATKRARWWNFVSSSRERIEQAKATGAKAASRWWGMKSKVHSDPRCAADASE